MGRNKKETLPAQRDGFGSDGRVLGERSEHPLKSEETSKGDDEESSPEDMIVICMGRFGMTFDEAYVVTPRAFFYYQKSYRIKRQEEMFMVNYSAWQGKIVENTKGKGKFQRPMFTNFEDFYNYGEEFSRALNGDEGSGRHKEEDGDGLTMAERNLMMGEALRRVREKAKKKK